MQNTISNNDDLIDRRVIIERIEELKLERDNFISEHGEEKLDEFNLSIEGKELQTLEALQSEAEEYAQDWKYGEQLIRRSYFEQAMDEMIEDSYELPKNLPSWMSIQLDYEALEQDYTSVDFDGVEYLIR